MESSTDRPENQRSSVGTLYRYKDGILVGRSELPLVDAGKNISLKGVDIITTDNNTTDPRWGWLCIVM